MTRGHGSASGVVPGGGTFGGTQPWGRVPLGGHGATQYEPAQAGGLRAGVVPAGPFPFCASMPSPPPPPLAPLPVSPLAGGKVPSHLIKTFPRYPSCSQAWQRGGEVARSPPVLVLGSAWASLAAAGCLPRSWHGGCVEVVALAGPAWPRLSPHRCRWMLGWMAQARVLGCAPAWR